MSVMEINMDKVYTFDETKQLGETDWPNKWLKIISDKLARRSEIAAKSAFLRSDLVELMDDCLQVK